MPAKNIISINGMDLLHCVVRSIEEVANAHSEQRPAAATGYFALRLNDDGRILMVTEIPANPAEKCAGRCFNSQEKGERLFANPADLLSWQTRDPEHGKWGGAIRTKDYILSFSGLPEAADETLMVIVAIKMEWLGKEDALDMLTISKNEIGKKLVEGLYE